MKSKKILLITFFLASFLFCCDAVYAVQNCYYFLDSSKTEEASMNSFGPTLAFTVDEDDTSGYHVEYTHSNNRRRYNDDSQYKNKFKELYSFSNNCPSSVYQCYNFNVTSMVASYNYLSAVDKTVPITTTCFEYILNSSYKPEPGNPKPDNTCESLFSEKLLKKINEYFNILKIVVPIIVIVLSSLDFAKSVLNSDNDDFKKSQIKFAKRLVLSVVFFLLPIILNFILQTINSNMSTCGIG